MSDISDIFYQLEYLKKDLLTETDKKEHSDFPINQTACEIIDHILKERTEQSCLSVIPKLTNLYADNPKNIYILGLLGFLHGIESDLKFTLKDPIKFFEEALAVNPHFIFAHHNLGYIYNHVSVCVPCPTAIFRKNEALAKKHLQLAAEKKYAPAIFELAFLLHGPKMPFNDEEYDSSLLPLNGEKFLQQIECSAVMDYPPAIKLLRYMNLEDKIKISEKMAQIQETLDQVSMIPTAIYPIVFQYMGWIAEPKVKFLCDDDSSAVINLSTI